MMNWMGLISNNIMCDCVLLGLFVVHAAVSLCSGVLAFAFPHLIAFLFGEEYHDRLRYNPDNETKVFFLPCYFPGWVRKQAPFDWSLLQVTHVVVRIFGALVLGQAWLTWHARKISDGEVRRAFVQVPVSHPRP